MKETGTPRRRRTLRRRFQRAMDRLFDGVGMRPLGIVVLAASALALVQLLALSSGSVRADAVAGARVVDHPSRVASFVTAVYVEAGNPVEVGAPLVQLSPYFIDQELLQLERESEQLINESRLAQARLVVNEERWLAPGLRQSPSRPSLERPTEAFFAKQLEVLHMRRSALQEDRAALTIRSDFAGIVAQVAWLGASVAAGASVASVMPEYAEEIVAYVPAETDPAMIEAGTPAFIVGADLVACRKPGVVKRRGASVEEAPSQLRKLFADPVHGMPVHVSIPRECRLGNGQVLTLDFRLGGQG